MSTLIPIDYKHVLAGPNTPEWVAHREFTIPHSSSTWSRRYWRNLRQLALAHWVGSERDVALINRSISVLWGVPVTRVFHDFDRLIDRLLRLSFEFRWDSHSLTHVTEGDIEMRALIDSLLSYYNAIFLEDLVEGKVQMFYAMPLAKPVPEVINLERAGYEPEIYHRLEFCLEELPSF